MEFLDLVKERHSIRKYLNKPVEEEKLAKILETARLSPTAANRQPQKIYVYRSEAALQKIRSFTKMAFNAPLVLHICYDNTVSWNADHFGQPEYESGIMDASIVTSMMMMEATDLGLGTLWVRGYNAEEIEKEFQLPENIKSVCLLLIGYKDERVSPGETRRKALEETVEIL
jgi:nitroreductase